MVIRQKTLLPVVFPSISAIKKHLFITWIMISRQKTSDTEEDGTIHSVLNLNNPEPIFYGRQIQILNQIQCVTDMAVCVQTGKAFRK